MKRRFMIGTLVVSAAITLAKANDDIAIAQYTDTSVLSRAIQTFPATSAISLTLEGNTKYVDIIPASNVEVNLPSITLTPGSTEGGDIKVHIGQDQNPIGPDYLSSTDQPPVPAFGGISFLTLRGASFGRPFMLRGAVGGGLGSAALANPSPVILDVDQISVMRFAGVVYGGIAIQSPGLRVVNGPNGSQNFALCAIDALAFSDSSNVTLASGNFTRIRATPFVTGNNTAGVFKGSVNVQSGDLELLQAERRISGTTAYGRIYASGYIKAIRSGGPLRQNVGESEPLVAAGKGIDFIETGFNPGAVVSEIYGGGIDANIDAHFGMHPDSPGLLRRITANDPIHGISARSVITARTFGRDALEDAFVIEGPLEGDLIAKEICEVPIVIGGEFASTGLIEVGNGGLQNNIVVNDANQSFPWAGTVKVGSTVSLAGVYYYFIESSTLGGGAIGQVPFRQYKNDSRPRGMNNAGDPQESCSTCFPQTVFNGAWSVNGTNSPAQDFNKQTPVRIAFYGPIVFDPAGGGTLHVKRLDDATHVPTVDFTSSVLFSVDPTVGLNPGTRVLSMRQMIGSSQFPAGDYRVTYIPDPNASVHKIACDTTGQPSVDGFTYDFRLLRDCDRNGVLTSGEPLCDGIGGTCNDLDYNNDGNIEPEDVDAYFSVLGEGPCLGGPSCDSLDFNNDGDIDPEDVDAYFSVLGEGPCLNY